MQNFDAVLHFKPKFHLKMKGSWRCWVVTAVMAICYLRESIGFLSDSRLREVSTVWDWADDSVVAVVAVCYWGDYCVA
jgi:hypothetical protein